MAMIMLRDFKLMRSFERSNRLSWFGYSKNCVECCIHMVHRTCKQICFFHRFFLISFHKIANILICQPLKLIIHMDG